MADASIPPALDLLREVENAAANTAIVSALRHLQPHVQSAALDVLVERNHQSRIAAVVAAFHSYDPNLRQLLSNRARDLHATDNVAVRRAVIRHVGDDDHRVSKAQEIAQRLVFIGFLLV